MANTEVQTEPIGPSNDAAIRGYAPVNGLEMYY
jgi:hypothetical protein